MESDILFGVVPALSTLGLLIVALVIYLAGPGKSRPRKNFILVEYIYWVFGPLVSGLAKLGVTPNMVTLTSLLLASIAGFALANGLFFVSTFIFALTVFCDIIDGNLARKTGLTTRGGAFLDSFMDRLAEGVLFLGIAYYGGGNWVTVVAVAALILSYAVSYARARGESLGVNVKVGFAQRPVRMFILTFSILFAGLSAWAGKDVLALQLLGGGSGIIAIIAGQTAFIRVRHVMKHLDAVRQVSSDEMAALPSKSTDEGRVIPTSQMTGEMPA